MAEYAGEDLNLQGLVVHKGGRDIMIASMEAISEEIMIEIVTKGNKKFAKVVPLA